MAGEVLGRSSADVHLCRCLSVRDQRDLPLVEAQPYSSVRRDGRDFGADDDHGGVAVAVRGYGERRVLSQWR